MVVKNAARTRGAAISGTNFSFWCEYTLHRVSDARILLKAGEWVFRIRWATLSLLFAFVVVGAAVPV
jgi:hypothetical protein